MPKTTLGLMHTKGRWCLQRTIIKAHMWFNLAAAQGDKDAVEVSQKIALKYDPAADSRGSALGQGMEAG
jgi:TPR repeat protein